MQRPNAGISCEPHGVSRLNLLLGPSNSPHLVPHALHHVHKPPGVQFYRQFELANFFAHDMDVVVFAVSILSFEEVVKSIPPGFLQGKLVVDVLSVKIHAKETLLEILPEDSDIL